MVDKASIIQNKLFDDFNRELLGLGATYLSIIVLDNNFKTLLSKSSDPDWGIEFIETGLYKNCHLLNKATELFSNHEAAFTLAWDTVIPVTDEAKNLDEIRKAKDIVHGVGFCSKDALGNRILLNVAGKYSDINFGLNVLKHRKEIYKDVYKYFLKLS